MVLFKAEDYTEELDLVIRNKFEKLETDKKLTLISIGKGHEKFVELKKKNAENYGIELEEYSFKTSVKKSEVTDTIKKLNESDEVGGIIVQYPFPSKFKYSEIAYAIDPAKDVDFFNPKTFGMFALNTEEDFMPPTVRALDFIIASYKLETKGQSYVILGQGVLVGRPMANFLLNRDVSVISINEHTKNKKEYIGSADILICASGSPKFVKGEMLKRGASVIDFGSGDKENPGIGDFDMDTELSHLNIVVPSPGGVGPLSIRFLFLNFLEFVEKQEEV